MSNNNILYISLLLLFATSANGLTGRYRCVITDVPSTTMTIGWELQSGESPILFYDSKLSNGAFTSSAKKAYPKVNTFAKGMNTFFVHLRNLQPNTVYYFKVVDSQDQSKIFSFRTLPDDHKARLSIIGGGDSRNNQAARQNANKAVAKLRPHFVLFAGDMTGGDSNREWREWLDDWQLTIGNDGRMTPIVPARGNHERSDQSIYSVFNVPNEQIYYDLSFCRGLLKILTLNSMQQSSTAQQIWLEDQLKKSQQFAWRLAQYHHPVRPHTKRKSEQNYLHAKWAPLFYKYGVQLILECDSHMSKITWPVRPSNNPAEVGYDEGFVRDEKGTVYIGEGGWGAPLRNADDGKDWTLALGSFNQVKWLFLDINGIEIRTVKTESIDQVNPLSDEDRFQVPSGIDLWVIQNSNVYRIANQNMGRFSPSSAQSRLQINELSATPVDNMVHITWSSQFESARIKYKIQVSTNKVTWKTLKIIPSKGPSEAIHQYKYFDTSPKKGGKYFYRIAPINYSGKELMHHTIEFRSIGNQSIDLINLPLENSSFKLPLSLKEDARVVLSLFDIKRNLLLVQKIELNKGDHQILFNSDKLRNGSYLIEMNINGILHRKNIQLNL